MLAVGLLFSGPLSDAYGRKNIMVGALVLASICTLLSTRMTSWHGILAMRMLIGLSFSGVAAVAMTYLAEEIHPLQVAFSMGLYISGNSIGGMSGRLLCGVLTDLFGWRIALTVIGATAILTIVLNLTRLAAKVLGFTVEDEITTVFCGSKKTLASGVPMAKLLFGAHPAIGLIVLPIMFYHQIQLLVCAVLANRYAARR